MTVLAYTDGASRGNPGQSGIGILLKDEQGNTLATHFDFIGTATNNVAEYKALVHCLKMAAETKCTHLIVHSDSELMVRQMQGAYKVKDKELRRFFDEARQMISSASFKFEIRHVAREENSQADELANKGINLRA